MASKNKLTRGFDTLRGWTRIEADGKSFRFPVSKSPDHIEKIILRRGTFYEIDLLDALKTHLGGRPGAVYDVGANIGNHTLYFAGVMGRQTTSFEPVKKNRAALSRLIEMNDLGQVVRVEPVACGSTAGTVHMSKNATENAGMYRVSETDEGEAVRLITLDSHLKDHPEPVALIKLDVEGFESAVLSGAQNLLARDRPILSIEAHSIAQYETLFALIKDFDYRPVGVFCWTPTIVFADTGDDISAQLSKTLADFEAKQKAARSD